MSKLKGNGKTYFNQGTFSPPAIYLNKQHTRAESNYSGLRLYTRKWLCLLFVIPFRHLS